MKFILEIELGNDAMQTGEDVIRSLFDSMKGEAEMKLDIGVAGRLWDVNGNIVGKWEVKQDEVIRRSREERVRTASKIGAFALIAALQDAGLKPRSYSGRAMYGKSCVGVAADSAFEIGEALKAAKIMAGQPDEDQLGKRRIFYWPAIEWPASHTA